MKRIAFVFLTIIFASYAVSGQQFSLGIKPSFLILDAKYVENPKSAGLSLSSRSSFGVGITLQRTIGNHFAIQLEPRFIEKGYNVDWGVGIYDVYKNDYLSLPTMLCIMPIKNFSFELGSEFSYLVNSKVKFNSGVSRDNKSNDIHHFELSFISGLSYSLFKRFDLGVRYGIGITPYAKGEVVMSDTSPFPIYKIYNRYFEFNFNYRILTKGKK